MAAGMVAGDHARAFAVGQATGARIRSVAGSRLATARAITSLVGAEPLRLQLGEEAFTLEVAEVPVDLGQQFLVLEARVDADHAGVPNGGITESGVVADRVAQDRQRIDDRPRRGRS